MLLRRSRRTRALPKRSRRTQAAEEVREGLKDATRGKRCIQGDRGPDGSSRGSMPSSGLGKDSGPCSAADGGDVDGFKFEFVDVREGSFATLPERLQSPQWKGHSRLVGKGYINGSQDHQGTRRRAGQEALEESIQVMDSWQPRCASVRRRRQRDQRLYQGHCAFTP